MKTVQKQLGYFDIDAEDQLHEALEATYGSAFAQWLVDRFPDIFTDKAKTAANQD